jgi:glycosyltransferase involved in cell wall biosynthesis
VLLSAYACEPHKGSEPGVGWRWALELSGLGHNVWVITRENNREHIEKVLALSHHNNLKFIYCDLPASFRRWKKLGGGLIYLYYLLWQIKAYLIAKKWHKKIHFTYVHHITFGVFRQPSFMYLLRIPFIFGPVGGGERAPRALRMSYPIRGCMIDFFRDVINYLARFDPFNRAVWRNAEIILCKTIETLNCLPLSYRSKCRIQMEIGIDSPHHRPNDLAQNVHPRLLYVGRLIYWKGLHLGLAAFVHLLVKHPNATLTIVGSGPDEQWFRKVSKRLNLDHSIEWHAWLPHEEIMSLYRQHDIFIFPSLHDSSGNVVLEALSNGLPVVCLNLGGPAIIVNETCGFVVETEQRNEAEVVIDIASKLIRLLSDQHLRQCLANGALTRSQQFQWQEVVSFVYADLGKKTPDRLFL